MTLTELAKQAGVSIATVSRVLNNGSVSKATKEKVESTILRLNYVPESFVTKIVNNPKKSIAIITHGLSNYFSMEFAEAISKKYNEDDIITYVCSGKDPQSEYQIIMDLIARGVNGIILHDPAIQNLKDGFKDSLYVEITKRIPFVVIHSLPSVIELNSITVDQKKGMEKVMTYLLEIGHKDIAFVRDNENYFSMSLKEEVWAESLKTAGITPHPSNVIKIKDSDTDKAIQNTEDALKEFFDQGNRPSVIFTCNDLMGLGALNAARDYGFHVPNDISIFSHDNTTLAASSKLTTVDMKMNSVAFAAIDLMNYVIEGKDKTPRHITIAPDIIFRKTVCDKK